MVISESKASQLLLPSRHRAGQ